jgi:APA family basic amino acid/polyamine antiporter
VSGVPEKSRLGLPAATALVLGAAAGAIAFALWMVLGSGYSAVYRGLFLVLLGVPIYVWMRSQRQAAAGDPVEVEGPP